MSSALDGGRADAGDGQKSPRLLDILATWRLQAAGYVLAAFYVGVFFCMYKAGQWLVGSAGLPIYSDFANLWIVGKQALHGNTAVLYDPAELAKIQAATVGPVHPKEFFFPNWPYPPIVFLLAAPLAMLPYIAAFLGFQAVSLLGCIIVVFRIVRRLPAIALVLGSPFTAINIAQGQTGFLMASLVGAALLTLERRPVLAGVLIGCIAYKPQFGVLFPVALIAGRHWRAFASAAIAAAVLAGVSIVAFGIGPWEAFPHQLLAQSNAMLFRQNPWGAQWALVPTVYGLVRALHGAAALAWLAQGCAAFGVAASVWLIWRSPARYPLKAALLSAAILVATPYAWPHDLTMVLMPIAFLASDQIRHGLLSGEQTIQVALFGVAFAMLFTLGGLPGPVMLITLVGVILRRVFWAGWVSEPAVVRVEAR